METIIKRYPQGLKWISISCVLPDYVLLCVYKMTRLRVVQQEQCRHLQNVLASYHRIMMVSRM